LGKKKENKMSKILVIEDDEDLRSGIIDLFTEEGYEVISAENGRLGIEAAKKHLPDLIVSDILMPEVDGFGVYKELQNDTAASSIPFIFLSARADNSDIRYGMNLGADDYLTKPYKADELIAAVSSRLAKQSYIDKKLDQLHTNIARSLPHEMRIPLVSVIGFSQLILDHPEELNMSEILDMVSKIRKSGVNLLNIIRKFLLFNELEIINADKSELRKYPGDSNVPSKEAIYSFASYIAGENNRRKDLVMNLCETDIKMNYEHLKFIAEELVKNACRFSEPGTTINLETRIVENNFFLEITDSGIGMTSKQIQEIGVLKQFERGKYFQDGLGLSLGVIGRILDIYDGSMEIQSEKEKFTKVIIKIKK